MNKKILLPLKVGDRVVMCPRNTSIRGRGWCGVIESIHDNLTVLVRWEDTGMPGSAPLNIVKSYHIRSERVCHNCVNRLQHLAGHECPVSWKEVRSIHEMVSTTEEA